MTISSEFESAATAAGATVHWARTGAEACDTVAQICNAHHATDVIIAKSLTTDEIRLNDSLAAHGIHALETHLAELILQLARRLVLAYRRSCALHRNRSEIRDILSAYDRAGLRSDEPEALSEAARTYLSASAF